ncbi:hypothetical protein Tco_0766042 [Tanacetum coccineum]
MVINNHFLLKQNTLPKRQSSFINIIKYDSVLGKLKFINKGEEHQKYGMSIPDWMINDAIRSSVPYLTYLAKSSNSKITVPKVGKGQGKGLIGKKKSDAVVQKEKKKHTAPRKKSSITADDNILPDPDEAIKLGSDLLSCAISDGGEAYVNEGEKEVIVQCKGVNVETDKEAADDQNKKLKGVAYIPAATQSLLNPKKGCRASKEDQMNLTRGLKMKMKILSSDDERIETDGSENADEEIADKEIVDKEIVDEEMTDEEKADDDQARDVQAYDDQANDNQVGVQIPETQKKKPEIPPSSSSLTLSSAEYGNQFLNDSSNISLVGILKEPAEIEIQLMVDVPVHKEHPVVQRTSLVDAIVSMFPNMTTPTQIPPTTEAQVTNVSESDSSLTILQRLSELEMKVKALSKVDHAEAIEESIQANIINEVKNQLPKYLPKAVSNYVKPRMESKVRDVLQKNPINLFQSSSTQADSLTEHELKNKLFDRMKKSGSFLEHEKHLELYNDLIGSIGLDEAIAKKHTTSTNSLKGKNTIKSSKTDKSVNAKEVVQEVAMEAEEPVEDDVVNVEEQPQDDAAPKQDNSIWFKQDDVARPETPDPDWHKESNADDAPKQNWFNELVNVEKDPFTFDDLMGTIDFTKFAKNCLKKDKITKADLEEPTFMLLKESCKNIIELEYNLE